MRAYPPRLVHILAGNSPMVAAMTVARGALTRGVNLLKLPSNDLFTVTAILRTLAEIAPDHPTTRSFAAVYWRGGDERTESILFRPQYFDKLVAWGGGSTIAPNKQGCCGGAPMSGCAEVATASRSSSATPSSPGTSCGPQALGKVSAANSA